MCAWIMNNKILLTSPFLVNGSISRCLTCLKWACHLRYHNYCYYLVYWTLLIVIVWIVMFNLTRYSSLFRIYVTIEQYSEKMDHESAHHAVISKQSVSLSTHITNVFETTQLNIGKIKKSVTRRGKTQLNCANIAIAWCQALESWNVSLFGCSEYNSS